MKNERLVLYLSTDSFYSISTWKRRSKIVLIEILETPGRSRRSLE